MNKNEFKTPPKKSRSGWHHVLVIAFIAIIVSALLLAWWVKQNIYASQFEPTRLSIKEQQVLDSKLDELEVSAVRESLPSGKGSTTIQVGRSSLNLMVRTTPKEKLAFRKRN